MSPVCSSCHSHVLFFSVPLVSTEPVAPYLLFYNIGGVGVMDQPTSSAIKEGDTVLYTPTAEGEKEVRARVVKVHPDAGGAHYTIVPHGKDAKEKNTTAERVSKVR